MDSGFRHQGCVYGSDAEFLAMAVPFAEDGLRDEEPVLVATTAANVALLRAALGAGADRLDYAERPDAVRRYWSRRGPAVPGARVRILSEQTWTGRSRRKVIASQRWEAKLNVLLAGTRIWMICPYDTRVVEPGIVEGARRTHPECVVGRRTEPSAQFIAPEEFARSQTSPPAPGSAADLFRFEGDLVAVRRHVLEKATPILVAENTVAMFDIAVGEVLAKLVERGVGRVTVWVRAAAGRVVCTLHTDQPLRPPALHQADAGLWMSNQICEWLDISSDADGCTIELAMPGRAALDTSPAKREDLGFGV
ncbi:MEDS: MEthanogen/methylotroph, DcmR Sensory domain [Amycolatopsis xylanica]|uniref:MEDS: MEthanogen/methylotroph, DcmR Sensory domain n=1 Tax=Amycolatopsis xylanica TaxID=589385 RepID=A0A1H2TWM2_9PSEU|nr:MEDS domain-containing protein [Amycolatopsis xylanica]SDW48333.1 MEDS: MEthanogen/methylotroph, DcmR Sensory domain [Amycolatopsis xylanica]